MQEQTTSSRWTSNPLTWAAKKLVNGTVDGISCVFNRGAVLAVTFVTQIPTVLADYCFTINGHFTPNRLNCANAKQLTDLSRDLHLQDPNVTAAPSYACHEIMYPNQKGYGTTALGSSACWLDYGQTLDPTVDSILKKNVQSGIFGGFNDVLAVILIVGASATVLTAGIYFSCRKLRNKWRHEGRERAIVENPVDENQSVLGSGHSGGETTADNEPLFIETDRTGRGLRPGYQGGSQALDL